MKRERRDPLHLATDHRQLQLKGKRQEMFPVFAKRQTTAHIGVTALTETGARYRQIARKLGVAAVMTLTFLASAELTARVEEWLLWDTPLSATPDSRRDLTIHDALGIRGRPNGQFKKWHLNSYGFRNGPMSLLPKPGVTRIMVLGASETFGYSERDGKEYPARFGARLESFGSYEVVNAAMTGLDLPHIRHLWDMWGVRFKPAIVVVYPTPSFYLSDRPPRRPERRATAPEGPAWPKPRLLGALTDRFDFPAFVQRLRVARSVAAARASHPPDWPFRTVPTDRLGQFTDDLAGLLDSIRAAGAEPILITHAIGFHNPPQPEEADKLASWVAISPRATADVLLQFEEATAEASRRLALEQGIRLVDLADHMDGDPRWFAEDYDHFSEEGADLVASLLADAIVKDNLAPRK